MKSSNQISILVIFAISVGTVFSYLTYKFNKKINNISIAVRDALMRIDFEYLGEMNVTMYSHKETGGKYTASNYKLNPRTDSCKVCAVSRELWQRKINQGDILYIPSLHLFLIAVDTMAEYEPNSSVKQLNWVDIYESDKDKVDEFGRQHLLVYRLKR